MAVFGSVLAYLWWNKAIAQMGSARTAVFFDLVPISTMLISVAFGHSVSIAQTIGSALVITGVACSSGIKFTNTAKEPRHATRLAH
jgi:drug/metabolite transporter (DMT)-like permease